MPTIECNFKVSFDKKTIDCVATQKDASERSVCVVIGHGASGDYNSGNLPGIAFSLAEAGLLVVRYNTSGQLLTRVKVLRVSCLRHMITRPYLVAALPLEVALRSEGI